MKHNERYLRHILKHYGTKIWYYEMVRLIKKDIRKRQYKIGKPEPIRVKLTTT